MDNGELHGPWAVSPTPTSGYTSPPPLDELNLESPTPPQPVHLPPPQPPLFPLDAPFVLAPAAAGALAYVPLPLLFLPTAYTHAPIASYTAHEHIAWPTRRKSSSSGQTTAPSDAPYAVTVCNKPQCNSVTIDLHLDYMAFALIPSTTVLAVQVRVVGERGPLHLNLGHTVQTCVPADAVLFGSPATLALGTTAEWTYTVDQLRARVPITVYIPRMLRSERHSKHLVVYMSMDA
ncbi:hypothetical protein BC828DRAFT_406640, partial [Blastocladiella britannica]